MITKEILEKLYLQNVNNKSFSDKPVRMFVNGKFNPKNWNGGDDLIRTLFSSIESDNTSNILNLYDEDDEWDYPVICNIDRVQDQTYATIVVDRKVYYFEWYKNRGCTEVAMINGRDMTENEYIKLLNLIEKSGFTFI